MLLALLIVGGIAIYIMSPDERKNAVRKVVGALRDAKTTVDKYNPPADPFRDALCERTPRILVTPVLVAINTAIFICMVFGAGSLSDPATLVGWGASVGPSTTNGEWWRLLTSLFVHAGFFELLTSMAVLFALGFVLERLVGHLAFASVYLASGVVATLLRLALEPLVVSAGSSASLFGLCGLLVACAIRGYFRPSPVTIPLRAAKVLGPVAGVFVSFSLLGSSGAQNAADFAALGVGLIAAAVLVRDVAENKPEAPRIVAVAAASAILCLVLAIPLSGTTDIRKDIEGVLAFEDRSAQAYDAAVTEFRKGWIKADALIALIDGKIRPELTALRTRLQAVKGMPREQQTLAARADEYFRLRDESWRLRARALHPPNTKGLKTADRAERASLEVLQEIRQADLR